MTPLAIDDRSHVQTSLLQMRMKKDSNLKACFSSAFVIVGISLLIASLNYFALNVPWAPEKYDGNKYPEHHKQFLKMGCNVTIEKHLKRLTDKPHVAGTPENFETAEYVLNTLRGYGLDAHYRDYEVLLSYPLSRQLSLSLAGGHMMQFELRERELEGDPSSKSSKAVPPFHAHSPSGSVAGEVVYVNYGGIEDFSRLYKLGINVSGAIVIARYGMVFRGDIVRNAAEAGAVGVIVYSDPQDYAANGTEGYYPESKWLPPSAVQGGTVFQELGDPLTPGWPSVLNSERLSDDKLRALLPSIPSLPISAENARVIINSLGGPVAPPHWHGALDLPVYRLGRGPGVLNLTYVANQTIAPIRNVFAVIRGSEEPDRYVLLGNHRDAWAFGAVDPSSGTATLLELARRFGKLLRRGWKPRRTIILCNWDAEEYGLVGSTEWVEENSNLLKSKAIAYLNVDCAVAGSGFFASSTPQLDELLKEATKQVEDPDNSLSTVYQSWIAANGKTTSLIGRLGGGGSDHSSFLQHLGIPAMDIYFAKDYPVYHSLYDDFLWMKKFGDPSFHRHVAVAGVWGLVALKLADEEFLPFSYETYADELQSYVTTLERQVKVVVAGHTRITTAPLQQSIAELRNASKRIAKQQKELKGYYGFELKDFLYRLSQKRALNDRLLMAERAFTDSDGLPGRHWYKHLIYGPSKHNDYVSTSFPAVYDSLLKYQ
eukprot:Gb_06073 [translate_table: standard]